MKRKLEGTELPPGIKQIKTSLTRYLPNTCIQEIAKVLEPEPFIWRCHVPKKTFEHYYADNQDVPYEPPINVFYRLDSKSPELKMSCSRIHLPLLNYNNIAVTSIPDRGWICYPICDPFQSKHPALLCIWDVCSFDFKIQYPPEFPWSEARNVIWDQGSQLLVYKYQYSKKPGINIWSIDRNEMDHQLYTDAKSLRQELTIGRFKLLGQSLLAVAIVFKKRKRYGNRYRKVNESRIDVWDISTRDLVASIPDESFYDIVQTKEYPYALILVYHGHLIDPRTGTIVCRDWCPTNSFYYSKAPPVKDWYSHYDYTLIRDRVSGSLNVYHLPCSKMPLKDQTAVTYPIGNIRDIEPFGPRHMLFDGSKVFNLLTGEIREVAFQDMKDHCLFTGSGVI